MLTRAMTSERIASRYMASRNKKKKSLDLDDVQGTASDLAKEIEDGILEHLKNASQCETEKDFRDNIAEAASSLKALIRSFGELEEELEDLEKGDQ